MHLVMPLVAMNSIAVDDAGNPPPDIAAGAHAPDALARAAMPLWGFSLHARARLINLSENATYHIEDPQDGRVAILRLHRPGYHTAAAIRSEFAWMAALRRDAGIETPAPIAALDGELLQTLEDPAGGVARHAALFGFLTGASPPEDAPVQELIAPFRDLGSITARLHAHAKDWDPPAGFTRHRWDLESMFGAKPIWGRWQDGMGVVGEAARLLGRAVERIARRLEAYGKAPARFGVIHADLRLANLLIDGRRIRVIDFDDMGYGWYLYDLAAALSFIEHRPEVPDLVAAWIAGYRAEADLAADEVGEIATFILLRRITLIAWIGSRRETRLAQAMGATYTADSLPLAAAYLDRFG